MRTPWHFPTKFTLLTFLTLLTLLLPRAVFADQPAVWILNPRPGETTINRDVICTSTLLNPRTYVINGVMHHANRIRVTVRKEGSATIHKTLTDIRLQGNLWECIWTLDGADTNGNYTITAVAEIGDVPSIPDVHTVTLTNTAPAGGLAFFPSSIFSGIYLPTANITTDTLPVMVTLRYATTTLPTVDANNQFTFVRLSAANSLEVVGYYGSNGALPVPLIQPPKNINNGTAVPNDGTIPALFTFGTAGSPFTAGIQTLTALFRDGLGTQTLSRSIIIDKTLPSVTAETPEFVGKNTVRFRGDANDPNNGDAPGGITSVAITLRRKDTTDDKLSLAERHPAHLVYGKTPADPVKWQLDYSTLNLISKGLYDVRVVATDNAGNSNDVDVPNFRVDTDSPTTVLKLTVANPAWRSGSVDLTLTATDAGSGVKSWELRDTTDTAKVVVLDRGTGSLNGAVRPFDTTRMANGKPKLTLAVLDNQFNEGTATLELPVDNGAPTITYTSQLPRSGNRPALVKSPLTVTGELKDPQNTDSTNPLSYEIWVDNTAPGPADTTRRGNGTGPLAINKTAVALAAGSHTIKIVGFDTAGNRVDSQVRTVLIDDTPPQVGTFTFSPALKNGNYVKGDVTLTATITDPASSGNTQSDKAALVWKVYDGVARTTLLCTGTGDVSAIIGTEKLTNGDHILLVVATDEAGNEGTGQASIRVDNELPTIAFASPGPAAVVGGGSGSGDVPNPVTLRVNVNDNDAIEKWQIFVGTTQIGSDQTTKGNGLTQDWNTYNPLLDGPITLELVAKDKAGNEVRLKHTVIVDNMDPDIQFQIPDENATVKVGDKVVAAVTDRNGLQKVTISYNGSTPKDLTAPYADTIPTLANGLVTIKIVATDSVGNKSERERKVYIGTASPVRIDALKMVDALGNPGATLMDEGGNYYLRQKIQAIGEVKVPNLGTKGWELLLRATNESDLRIHSDTKNVTGPLTPATHWDTTGNQYDQLGIKRYTLILQAFDSNNVLLPSDSRTVIIDNTAPVVSLDAPQASGADSGYVRGTVTLRATVTENNPKVFQFSVEDKDHTIKPLPVEGNRLRQTGTNTYELTYDWNTQSHPTSASVNDTKVLLVVTDKAGNENRDAQGNLTTSSTQTVTIVNTDLDPKFNASLAGSLVAGKNKDIRDAVAVKFTINNSLFIRSWRLLANNLPALDINGVPIALSNITGPLAGEITQGWDSYAMDATPTRLWADGPVTLRLVAEDRTGQIVTAEAPVLVDNTPPDIGIPQPIENASVALGALVETVYADSNYYFIGKTGKIELTFAQGTHTFTKTLSPNCLEPIPTNQNFVPGGMKLTLVATDAAGNRSVFERNIVIIGQDSLQITQIVRENQAVSPIEGIYYLQGLNDVRGEVNVPNLSEWKLIFTGLAAPLATGNAVVSVGELLHKDWNTGPPLEEKTAQNPDNLYLEATDSALGKLTSLPLKIVLDNTPPTLELKYRKASDAQTVRNSIDIQKTLYLRGGVTFFAEGVERNISANSVEFFLDRKPVPQTLMPGIQSTVPAGKADGYSSEVFWNTQGFDGVYFIRARIKDRAGHSVDSSPIRLAVDNILPRGQFIFPTPSEGAVVKGEVPIRFSIADNGHLESWFLTVNGEELDENPDGKPNRFTNDTDTLEKTVNWPTNSGKYPDGVYTLRLTVVDRAGNENAIEITRKLTVDNRSPEPSLSLPSNLDMVSGSVLIRGFVSEVNPPASGDLWRLEVTPSAGQLALDPGSTTRGPLVKATWDAAHVTPGWYTITLTSFDAAGTQKAESVQVYVGDPKARLWIAGYLPGPGKPYNEDGTDWVSDYLVNNRPVRNVAYAQGEVLLDEKGQIVRRLRAYGEVENWSQYLLRNEMTRQTRSGVLSKQRVQPSGTVQTQLRHGFKDTPPADAPNNQRDLILLGMDEGRHLLRLQSTNDNNHSSVEDPFYSDDGLLRSVLSTLEVVVDNTAPKVEITAPKPPTGIPAIVAPGGLLTLKFRVENLGVGSLAERAPLHRLKKDGVLLDIPYVRLRITQFDIPANFFEPSLVDALDRPDPTKEWGIATVQNRGNGVHEFTWQLPIVPSRYAYGKRYRLEISDVRDIVFNAAGTQTLFFQILTN